MFHCSHPPICQLAFGAVFLHALTWASLSASALAEEFSPHEQTLKAVEIEADAPSLRQFLLSLHPNSETRNQISALLAQLGDEDFHRREQAMKQLLRLPAVAVDLVQQAVQGADPEISWRARQIHKHAEQASRDLLHAAFAVIEKKKLRGDLVEPLLLTVPLCSEEYLRDSARRALLSAADPVDAPLLEKHFTHADPHVRIAALSTLAKLLGAKADEPLLPLLKDADERVRAVAARALLNDGRRESLPVLVTLLDSTDLATRLAALRTLKSAVGQDFGFVAYEDAKLREPAREKWRAWLANDSGAAALKTPLGEAIVEIGRVLVSHHAQNKLVEFDVSGKLIWEQVVDAQPWCCQGLPDGRRLVASYNNKTVIEYDATGKEAWRATGLPGGPTSVQRLENGNTLLACTDSQKLAEVDRSGKIVSQIPIEGRPVDAQRLDDGRTLVALQNGSRVVEVDQAGKVVWEIRGLANPFSAQRLENGNTLVALMAAGQVVEFDRAGKRVWSKDGLVNPYDAQRLPSGNTLVVDNSGLTEVDPTGKAVWTKPLTGISRVSRY